MLMAAQISQIRRKRPKSPHHLPAVSDQLAPKAAPKRKKPKRKKRKKGDEKAKELKGYR